VRRGNYARVALAGPPGSGKTWTALTVGATLAGTEPMLVIDTERRSASLYADDFTFETIDWSPPYDPRELASVIADVAARYGVVIVDSGSHFWMGDGGTLSIVDDAAARARGNDNKFAAWKTGTPAQQSMVDAILAAPAHVIFTMRSKVEYVQRRNDQGKTVVERIGMAPVQRDGIEYEFTVVGDLDIDHRLVVGKTRCSALAGKSYRPGDAASLGAVLRDWLAGAAATPPSPEAVESSLSAARDRLAAPPAGAAAQPWDFPGETQATKAERDAAIALVPSAGPARAAFVAWLQANRIPPLSHPDLTSAQALLAKAYLANLDSSAA
jgi:hypothetical protein